MACEVKAMVQQEVLELVEGSYQSEQRLALELIYDLCEELDTRGITYCHWKSNAMLDRSVKGENDLDLLVSRADVRPFTEILFGLGFIQAFDSPDRSMPGVLDFYGYDQASGKVVHVHAHYQLVLGQDATKNYHLPIEKPYLASVIQAGLLKVPAPVFELIVLVIRMVLKHSTWDAILGRLGALSPSECQELSYLQNQVSQPQIDEILKQHLPTVNAELFEACLHSLQPGCPVGFRVKAGRKLQTGLSAYARRSQISDLWLKQWRRLVRAIQRRAFQRLHRKHIASGGLMVAILGGDGSGKTTAVDLLFAWLARDFETIKVHMGKPRWSWTTTIVRGILKFGRSLGLYQFMKAPIEYTLDEELVVFPGYPWMIREVCTARDRYLTYRKARRFATNGGVVICDRFPLPQIQLMDGPQIERMVRNHPTNRLIKFLARQEKKYYQPIMPPELLIVLRTDPEICVQRKKDENPASVQARSREIWELDWRQSPAWVVDAGQPKAEVLSDLKNLIWLHL